MIEKSPELATLEKVRFVGKHSKDSVLSLYLQKRNIYEFEGNNCEQLGCIVRVNNERMSKEKVVVIGVLARVICDFGLQYTEHVLYQAEAQLYPRLDNSLQARPDAVGGIFDFETRFVMALPDEFHIPLLVKLPKGLPPSVHLRSSGLATHWGVTWYIFAYATNEKAASSTLLRHGIEGAWPRMRLGRRHSKVFLSFSKTTVASIERISRSLPASTGVAKRRGFLSTSAPLILEASLDKTAYYSGEPIVVKLFIRNDGKQRVNGVRITLKQLVTIKYANDPKQTIKSTIAQYEGHEQEVRDATSFEANVVVDTKFNSHAAIGHHVALETVLPQTPESPKLLAASTLFGGYTFSGGHAFGVEKLRVFGIEYYINVHAIIPWANNVIVKLPFQLVSNGGVEHNFEVPPPTFSSLRDSSPSLATSSYRPPHPLGFEEKSLNGRQQSLTRATPLHANLISFDLYADDDQEPMDNILDQTDDCDGDRYSTNVLAPVSSTNSGNNGKYSAPTDKVPFETDLATARLVLESSRSAINGLHTGILKDKLDRRSRSLQCLDRRTELNVEFVEQLNRIIIGDLAELESSLALAKKGDSLKCAAFQGYAFHLGSLGQLHTKLVSLSFDKELVEEHLEAFSQILDDFDLLLSKAVRRAFDEATKVLDRMRLHLSKLVEDLAGYHKIERSLKRLLRSIILRRWANYKATTDESLFDSSDNESSDEDSVNGFPCHRLNDAEEQLAAMANQFQRLYDSCTDGEASDDYEITPILLSGYCKSVRLLLLTELEPCALSLVAFFNWRFLFTACEQHYLGTYRGTSGLLFNSLRDVIRWSGEIERRIPARFLLQNASKDDTLEDDANQVVQAMQSLL